MALVQRGSGVWGDGVAGFAVLASGSVPAIPVAADNAPRFGSVASFVPGDVQCPHHKIRLLRCAPPCRGLRLLGWQVQFTARMTCKL